MFKTIFLDLDDTLLDFGAAERVAVSKTFREFGLEPTEALLRRYSEINKQQWECFERGEITRDTVLVELIDGINSGLARDFYFFVSTLF